MKINEEDPPCNYCRLMEAMRGRDPEEFVLRAWPGGTIELIHGDQIAGSFGELTLACLCGQHR
jgi:hypothetical protein